MDSDTKEYRRFRVYMILGAALSFLAVIIFSYAVSLITANTTYEAAFEVKKTMLRENIENTIAYLDVSADKYMKQHPDASAGEIESAAAEVAREKIYSETHIDGTYMWVQKVLNYDGGDNYAIRLIHPNLSDTEGDYLSTETLNPAGMKAYEEELNGIKENGSVYLTYDFKKLNSEDVSKKVTYSCLYKRFDWIVCMGVNIDDLEHYQNEAISSMLLPQAVIVITSSAIWLTLLFMMFRAYSSTRGRIFERRNKELSDKLYHDTVTGADSRIRGQDILEESFREFRNGAQTPLLLMLDVDYFKQFNDTYGHAVGDRVLTEFVNAVKMYAAEGDAVIRWGGDEFIAVFRSVPEKELCSLGDNILNAIRSISIPELNGKQITASMGFTYYRSSDSTVKEALDRADEAVYEAKELGRNNWRVR